MGGHRFSSENSVLVIYVFISVNASETATDFHLDNTILIDPDKRGYPQLIFLFLHENMWILCEALLMSTSICLCGEIRKILVFFS